jgi:hypothetical protein
MNKFFVGFPFAFNWINCTQISDECWVSLPESTIIKRFSYKLELNKTELLWFIFAIMAFTNRFLIVFPKMIHAS